MNLPRFLLPVLSDLKIRKKYIEAGASFGSAVSVIYMGECIGFRARLDRFEGLEWEYARRGFRTVSVDDFVEFGGGYVGSIDHLLDQKRDVGEQPVYHARLYREHFLGRVSPALDLDALVRDGSAQCATYVLPSTVALVTQ